MYAWLQWGREHVLAEIPKTAARKHKGQKLQWGREHVLAEICVTAASTV